MATQLSPLSGSSFTPTTVKLNNGIGYTIPAGERGTFAWVRQASLIAVAYQRDMQNSAKAAEWRQEYERRLTMWNTIQAGNDRLAVLRQFGADLLQAPILIAQSVGDAALGLASDAKDTVFGFANALPWLVGGLIVVIGLGFYKGSLKVGY